MMKRKVLFTGLSAMVVILAIALYWWQANAGLKEFSSPHVSFRYPVRYAEEPRPSRPGEADILIRLKSSEPESLIMLAEEKKAIKGARVTRTAFLDFLERNAERQFQLSYRGYRKTKSERITISGREASLTEFRYTGKDGKTTAHTSFLIITREPDAYYLTIQSTDSLRVKEDTSRIRSTMAVN
ncbi:MAG: hypothetical protein HYY50_05155 [Candidatus Kerfeldbacteria bacterium]|nr:hypothetical protein [Candidatus Kerfeldbacteria bacterium]